MRQRGAAWSFLLLLVLAPGLASAQGEVLDDPAADVGTDPATGPVITAPAGARDYADLVSLSLMETDEAFTFFLQVASKEPSNAHSYARLQFGFRHESTEFLVHLRTHDLILGTVLSTLGQVVPATLERRPAGDDLWREVGSYDTLSGPGGEDTWIVAIPRGNLTDEDGAVPSPGRVLEDFWGLAIDYQCAVSPCVPSGFTDRMPDQGTGDVPFIVQDGPSTDGAVGVTSPRPLRASNGEEGTFVFEVVVENRAESAQTLVFRADRVPSGWEVDLPVPAREVAGGAKVRVPIILTIPFNHEHGNTETFTLRVEGVDSTASAAAIDLGIRYLDVPQPAGHHPVLWVHAAEEAFGSFPGTRFGAGYNAQPFMNTLVEDPEDSGSPVGPDHVDTQFYPGLFTWCIPLQPGLTLGLDFDVSRTGTLDGEFAAPSPMAGTLSGRLLIVAPDTAFTHDTLCGEDPAGEVGLLEPVSMELGIDEPVPLSMSVVPLVETVVDRPAQNLFLELQFDVRDAYPRSHVDQPFLESGAHLMLPLNEYRDPVPVGLEDGALLRVVQDFHAVRNPGGVAVFDLELTEATSDTEFGFVGTRKEWAEWLPNGTDPRRSAVAVRVPADAPDGAVADLLVRARGDGVLAFARVVVEVDADGQHPDDNARLQALESMRRPTPLSPMVALAAVAFALALRWRR